MANKAGARPFRLHLCVYFLPLKISDIESRIAALSAAGLTVKPVEKARKKSTGQVSIEDGGMRGPSPKTHVHPRIVAAVPGRCEGLFGFLS